MEKDVYFYISLKIKSMSYHHPLHYVNEAHFIERGVGGWGCNFSEDSRVCKIQIFI